MQVDRLLSASKTSPAETRSITLIGIPYFKAPIPWCTCHNMDLLYNTFSICVQDVAITCTVMWTSFNTDDDKFNMCLINKNQCIGVQ